MPHGYPPWSGIKKQTVFSLPIDMAELAVRLGSPVTFDRRGDVVYLDSFADGLGPWSPLTSGTGGGVAISTERTRSGAYSCRLTGGSSSSEYARISKGFPLPALGKIGLEVSFNEASLCKTIEAHLFVDDGTAVNHARIRYNCDDGDFEYYDSGGSWVDLDAATPLYSSNKVFHTMKLVFDLVEMEYTRAALNDEWYAMPGIAGEAAATTGYKTVLVLVYVYSDTGENGVAYIDDVILTQNEL